MFCPPVLRWLSVVVTAVAVGLSTQSHAQQPSSPESNGAQILNSAAERIEQHRKGDLVVRVVDREGRPVSGAKVAVKQMRHAFLFGCNIYKWGKFDDPKLQEAYNDRFAEVFNYATVAFYWPRYEPERGQPNHKYAHDVVAWLRERNITPKGHPLAWNYREPDWLPEDSDEIYKLQLARIADCVKEFRGEIGVWDVVNEATHFEREKFAKAAPRLTATWNKVGRIEFAKACFEQARAANPEATLLINDYRMDEAYQHKVIERLVDENGKPLYDVIGLQSHMHTGAWTTQRAWEVCERYARYGAPLHFTEMTILSGQRGWREDDDPRDWPTTDEGEARQAREVEQLYTLLFSHPAVEAITWWDFCDYHAWKKAPAGFLRKDMSPKPSYQTLRRLIKNDWWTDTEGVTNADGALKVRGFLGDYRIRVTAADGAVKKVPAKLSAGKPTVVKIVL